MTPHFRVTEPDGSKPDLRQIALDEIWARFLAPRKTDGFALMADGTLVLLDECGHYAAVPLARFRVEWDEGTEASR